jgi:hypothetical protein
MKSKDQIWPTVTAQRSMRSALPLLITAKSQQRSQNFVGFHRWPGTHAAAGIKY